MYVFREIFLRFRDHKALKIKIILAYSFSYRKICKLIEIERKREKSVHFFFFFFFLLIRKPRPSFFLLLNHFSCLSRGTLSPLTYFPFPLTIEMRDAFVTNKKQYIPHHRRSIASNILLFSFSFLISVRVNWEIRNDFPALKRYYLRTFVRSLANVRWPRNNSLFTKNNEKKKISTTTRLSLMPFDAYN